MTHTRIIKVLNLVSFALLQGQGAVFVSFYHVEVTAAHKLIAFMLSYIKEKIVQFEPIAQEMFFALGIFLYKLLKSHKKPHKNHFI